MGQVIDCDVLILGGGLAGLTCAMGLRDTGLRLVLVEREPILGGRARSWRDPTTGDPIQLGPHVLHSDATNLLRLFELLGTRDVVRWSSPARAPSAAPLPRRGLVGLATDWPVAQLALAMRDADALRLDRLDAATVLSALGVHTDAARRAWTALSYALLDVPLDRASAGALLRAYAGVSFRPSSRDGYAPGGLGELFATRVRTGLEHTGHRVLTRATAIALCVEEEHIAGVELADGRRIRARHVVSALPPQALRALASEPMRRRYHFLDELDWFEPIACIGVYLWLDRKVTARAHWSHRSDEADLARDFFDYSNIFPGRERGPSLIGSRIVSVRRAAQLSDEAIARRILDELAADLPAAREARLRHLVVNRVPITTEAPRPGFEARRPAGRTRLDGLILAGDWTRTGHPSSMESAAASGWRAAELIADRIGLVRHLVQPAPRPRWIAQLVGAAARSTHLREWMMARITRGAELASPRVEVRSRPWLHPPTIST